MKVREIVNKINYGTAKLPVYLQEGAFGEMRKLYSMDFADYYYEHKLDTVTSISIEEDKLIIHYRA